MPEVLFSADAVRRNTKTFTPHWVGGEGRCGSNRVIRADNPMFEGRILVHKLKTVIPSAYLLFEESYHAGISCDPQKVYVLVFGVPI